MYKKIWLLLSPCVSCTFCNVYPVRRELEGRKEEHDVNSSCGRLCLGPSRKCEHFCVPENPHFFPMWRDCGTLCSSALSWFDTPYYAGRVGPGKWFDTIRKKVDCHRLFASPHMDVKARLPHVPHFLRRSLRYAFTYAGRVELEHEYWNQKYYEETRNASEYTLWTRSLVQTLVESAEKGILEGTYTVGEARCLAKGIKMVNVSGKHALVIGSEVPWVEAILLAQGAATVTTLEYAHIVSEHPRIKVVSPGEFRQLALSNALPKFDVAVSFSSVEHSGLGRYGDALNPWADLITIAKAWCVLSPSGALVLGVPMALGVTPDNDLHDGGKHGGSSREGFQDVISFNAHRVYGPVMYAHLVANFGQRERVCGYQLVHTFDKLPPL